LHCIANNLGSTVTIYRPYLSIPILAIEFDRRYNLWDNTTDGLIGAPVPFCMINLVALSTNSSSCLILFSEEHIVGIAFDLDGTLVDSTPDLLAAINAILLEYNLSPSDARENLSYAGGGLASMFARTIEARVPTWTSEKKDQMTAQMLEFYRTDPSSLTTPFPGMVSLLEAIQAKDIPMGVISNKLVELTQKVLRSNYPSITFSKVYGIDSGFAPKPDSGSLLDFKSTLGPDEELIYVGDTEIDYRTAKGVADRVFLGTWGYRGVEGLLEHGIDKALMVSDTAQLACALDISIS